MLVDIVSGLITTALIEGGKNLGAKMFREEDIRDWMSSSDFAEFFDEKIRFEAPPEPAPDPATLTEFFSSEVVPLIVEQVFEQNEQSLSKLEEDFVEAFEDYTAASETLNPEFAHWLFRVLISAFKSFLSAKARDGNPIANEYLRIVRRKEEMEEHREIKVGMEVVQKSIIGIPKFIPWQKYFKDAEQYLLPLDAGLRLRQTTYCLNKAEEFLADNLNRILVLHTPGGSGKSHLLRQIASGLGKKHPEYTILSVAPGSPDLGRALVVELDITKRYLLLFDDADRWPEELAPLFAYVKYRSSTVKIILTTQTAGLQEILATLNQRGCRDLAKVMRIRDWDQDDLKELLRHVLGGKRHRQEELIVAMMPNPGLIIWAGKMLKGEPGIAVEKLRQRSVGDLEFEAFKSLFPEFNEKTAKNFLADLALIGSFRKDDRTILSLLSERHGIAEDTVKTHIALLVENGVLRVVGFSIRFNPDAKGDLYLASHIDQIHKFDALIGWIDFWESKLHGKILAKLETASRYCNEYLAKNYVKSYFSVWIQRVIRESKITPGYLRREHLEALFNFCHLVPGESLDLMYTYIDTPLPKNDNYLFLSPNRDIYGAVILPLIQTKFSRNEIFDILDYIHKMALEGQYFNYKVESLVSETVSPFYNTFEEIRETLTLLEQRLDTGNEFSIIALGKALSEVLQGAHEMSYLSAPNTVTWGTQLVPATSIVLETRDHAISMVKRMLRHQSVQVRRKAIEISSEIGFKFGMSESALSERIAEERRILLVEFERVIPHETDYGVLSDIESLLFQWWQYKSPGTEGAESILKAFPRPMEYIIYGFLFYSRPLLLSFDPETMPSGKEERRKWCLSVMPGFAIPEDIFTEFSEPIVSFLSTKYPEDSVIPLFQELQAYQERPDFGYHRLELLLSAWITKNPDMFLDLRGQEQAWSELPVEIKNAIDVGLCKQIPGLLESLADEILITAQEVDTKRIGTFIRLIVRYPPDENRARNWLIKLIDSGDRETHLEVLINLSVFSSNFANYEVVVTLYLDILSYYEVMDEKLFDIIATYVLHDLIDNEDRLAGHQKEAIKKCLSEKLILIPSFWGYPGYEIQALINYVLTDTEEVLDFIHERAEKRRAAHDYLICPQDDVSLLENIGSCTELYSVLDELFALMNEGLVYREQFQAQLRSIASLKHQVSGKLCLEDYAEQLLSDGRVDDALVLCSVILSQSGTEETTLKILADAVAADKDKEIKGLFSNFVWFGGISSKGGHSPELERKREVISRILNLAPQGRLRVTLREVLRRVDTMIQTIKKEHEEDWAIS